MRYTDGKSAFVCIVAIGFAATASAQTLPTPEDLSLWLRADAGVVHDSNGRISIWQDQSGNSSDATQANSGQQPFFTENAINGLPIVHFNGGQYFLLPDVMNGATAGEIFVVLKTDVDPPTGSNGLWYFANHQNGWGMWYPWRDGWIQDGWGSVARYIIGDPSQTLDQYHIYNVSSQSGEWVARINGLSQYQSSDNSVTFASAPLIGRNSENQNFRGDIAEIIIYDHVLEPIDRQIVEYYLGGKYPVIAPLPAIPDGLSAIALSPTQVSLIWNYDLGNVTTQFEVDRKTGEDDYTTIAIVTDATSYLDLDAAGGIGYTYRVRTINYSGQSDYSNEANLVTPQSGGVFPTAGMRLWLRADSDTGNPIAVWGDQSGNGMDALQNSSFNRPSVQPNAINGRPVVHFAGNQWLNLPNLMNGATAGEIFVVLKTDVDPPTGSNGLWYFANHQNGWGMWYPWRDGWIQDGWGSVARYIVGDPSQALDQYHIYNVSSQSGEWVARINGLSQYQSSDNSVTFASAPLIGRNSENQNFRGDIAEVIIYDRVLNWSERERVDAYLGAKYLLPDLDVDRDGLSNSQEQAIGTDPYNWDTNGDFVPDGAEYYAGFDPLSNDVDGDGLTNSYEYLDRDQPLCGRFRWRWRSRRARRFPARSHALATTRRRPERSYAPDDYAD